MESLTYDFDPEGDVLLILNTGPSAFCWDHDVLQLEAEQDTDGTSLEAPEEDVTPDTSPESLLADALPHEANGFSYADPNDTPPASPGLSTKDNIPMQHFGYETEECIENINCGQMKAQMRVSSRHLVLASPMFRAMLSGRWMESQTNDSGIRQITADSWDLEAFVIFLNIIHNRTKAVPRSLSLETLAKFALIVDYYQCYEPVDFFVVTWLEKLKPSVPDEYGKQSALWLLISSIFSQGDVLEQMTMLTVKHCKHPFRPINIPIPEHVLDKINNKREEYLAQMFSALYSLIESLCDKSDCSFECSAILLGTLMKEMKSHGILNPQITTPYPGHSVESINTMVKNLRHPIWHRAEYYSTHGCTLQDELKRTTMVVEEELHVWKMMELDGKMA